MTTLVNLWAGPGTGKSTVAAGLFYTMKTRGENVELIREYAKELCWEGLLGVAEQHDLYLVQERRTYSLNDKVSFAITDSPLRLGPCIYSRDAQLGSLLDRAATGIEAQFGRVVNILLSRTSDHPFNPAGREQDEDAARAIDQRIRQLPIKFDAEFSVNQFTVERILTWLTSK